MSKGRKAADPPAAGKADPDTVPVRGLAERLKDVTRMKVVIKGLDNGEDAALAVQHGADGIIVSNHGGRATETGRGTIEALPEVIRSWL